jgi:parvulin-like peptidyl-prolyl isomerase
MKSQLGRAGGQSINLVRATLLAIALCISATSAVPDDTVRLSGVDDRELYARVGEWDITLEEYKQEYHRAVRQRYYHSKPPDNEVAQFREEVAQDLITRHMLLQEAGRRGIRADDGAISETLQQYDHRYAGSAGWSEQKQVLLAALRHRLVEDDLLRQLESRTRNIAPPTQSQVREYYDANPDKFTEPMRQRLSLILLLVDPSSPKEAWQAALAQGQALVSELRAGADFAELARLHSGDVSASRGGDMGYLHREMLSDAAQQVVDALEPGELSDAVRLLQGVAIIRLDEIMPQRLRAFGDVTERARGLLMRQIGDDAWRALKQRLRLDTPVTVYNRVADIDNDV